MRPFAFLLAVSMVSAALLCFAPQALASDGNVYFNIPVKSLLAEPTEEGASVFEIPIEVRLLGISADKKWVKVKIAFDLIFLGHYEYTGWTPVPKMKDYVLQEAPTD